MREDEEADLGLVHALDGALGAAGDDHAVDDRSVGDGTTENLGRADVVDVELGRVLGGNLDAGTSNERSEYVDEGRELGAWMGRGDWRR